jgi:tetratricopeptide (TPR) repeat protein
LLTLEPAFTGNDRQELLRQIAFEEPRPPRQLNKRIPTELEIIVLKALEKNPAERYATAQELADDLRRFLDDKPIRARRPTLRQRLTKWGRRHKGVVASAVAALVVAVVALAVSTTWVWKENQDKNAALALAQQQREAAERARGKALDAVQRMLARVGDEWVADIPQMKEVRQHLLEDAAALYTDLIDLNLDDARAYHERAWVCHLLGRYHQARADYERAAAMEPGNAEYHGDLVCFFHNAFRVFPDGPAQSLYHARRMVELRPTDAEARTLLGSAYGDVGQRNEGSAELRKAAQLARGTALEHKLLAVFEKEAGNWRSVIAHLQQAREMPPPDLWVYYYLAQAHGHVGEGEQALAVTERGLELARRPSNEAAGTPLIRASWRGIEAPLSTGHALSAVPTSEALAALYWQRGGIYMGQKKYLAAVADFNKSLDVAASTSRLPWVYARRALAHLHLGHYEDALADVTRAVELSPDDLSNITCISPNLLASCPDGKFRAGMLELAGKTIELVSRQSSIDGSRMPDFA